MNGFVETNDGRSTRWESHRAQRRLELARHARRAIHRNGPEISMEDIAKHAGTSKSIFYRYFSDKAGLQNAVGELVAQDLQRLLSRAVTTSQSPTGALRAMVQVYLDTIDASPHVYNFISTTGQGLSGPTLNQFLTEVIDLVARPLAQELADYGMPPAGLAAWAAGAVGYVRGIGEWWMAHRESPNSPSAEQLTQDVATWLWHGPIPQETLA